jgi:trigger factor
MKVEVEEISATERRIVVEIPSERVTSEYEHAYLDVARHATVKGFRKGKVPRKVLEQRFGDDVRSQVTQTLVQVGFSHALDDAKLDIVSQPELDFEPPVSGQMLRLSAKVEIRPELGEVDISGLAVQRPKAGVADEEVEKVLEQIRDRHAELAPVEDRKELASGDYAMIAIAAESEGEKVDALSVDGGTVEVGAGHLPEAVDEKLATAKIGDTFSVDAPAPDHAPEELKDKIITFEVTVQSISEKKVPELDDEFAKDHGDCDTVDAMRTQIREQLEGEARSRADGAVNEAIVDAILERTKFDAPAGMVSGRIESLMREFAMELAQQGMRLTTGEHEEEAREKLRPRAEREVRSGILLDHMAAQLEVVVDEEAVTAEVLKIVESAGPQADRAREHFAEESNRDSLRGQIQRSRTLGELVEKAEITEVTS